MKLIIACYFVAVVPICHSSIDSPGNNGPENTAAYSLNYVAGQNGNQPTFKENKMLIAEFSEIVKDNVGDTMISAEEKIKRQEVRKRVRVD